MDDSGVPIEIPTPPEEWRCVGCGNEASHEYQGERYCSDCLGQRISQHG